MLTHRYMYGPLTDQVLIDEVFNAAGQTTDVLRLIGDRQNTVRNIWDDNDLPRKTVNYDSFGNVVDQTFYGAYFDELFGYTGQEFDKATGLYNYNARWYDPAMGRFLSEDPIGFGGGDKR